MSLNSGVSGWGFDGFTVLGMSSFQGPRAVQGEALSNSAVGVGIVEIVVNAVRCAVHGVAIGLYLRQSPEGPSSVW